jgi:hypothetical protein
VSACDELFVDEVDLLPEILGAGFSECARRIQMPRDFEDPRPDRGEKSFYGFHYAVVEGVDRAVRRRLPYRTNHQRLDVPRLDLDKHCRTVSDCVQNFRERGNEHSLSQRKAPQLIHGKIRNARSPCIPEIAGLNDRVVVYYHRAVACRMYVQLNSLGSKLDGAQKSGNRILGKSVMRTPVGDRDRSVGRSDQAWPLVS